MLIYSLMVLIYYLYIQGEDRKDRKKKEDALQLQVREAEIDRIKAQINPHFLFNSLNSIASLTVNSPESAREMLVKLSTFLRYSFEYNENELTCVSKELEHIEMYMAIEKVRFGDRLNATFTIAKGTQDCKLPNMILQPLFENAIKHGVYESIEPIDIHTEARCEKGQLMVKIRNNFDPEAPPRKGKGFGLKLVASRLSLVYQVDNLMLVNKRSNTFEVTLVFPQLAE